MSTEKLGIILVVVLSVLLFGCGFLLGLVLA